MLIESPHYHPGTDITTHLPKNKKISIRVSNMLQMHFWQDIFLLLNRGDLKQWILQAWLVWGGAHIRDKKYLKRRWVIGFSDINSGNPERFVILSDHIDKIIEIVRREVISAIEAEIERELREELTQEIFRWRRDTPILSSSDIRWLPIKFSWRLLSKVKRNPDGSILIKFVRLFKTIVSPKIWAKMKEADSVVFVPSSKELTIWAMERAGETIQIANMAIIAHRPTV